MTDNIIELVDKFTLLKLKQDLLKDDIIPEDILESYYNDYQRQKDLKENYEKITCNVNFGYNRNLKTFKRDLDNMIPCSRPQNYPNIRKARGPWKNIYEIAFGVSETNNVTTYIEKEKSKQIKIIEAA